MKPSSDIYFFVGSNFKNKGGVEIHLKNLISNLGHKNISVIANIINRNEIESLLPNTKLIFANYDNSTFSIIKRFLLVVRLPRNAIFHFHDYNSFIKFGFFAKLIIKSKLYVTFHGWEGHYPLFRRDKLIRRLVKYFADATINVGEFIKTWYNTIGDETIYGGVSGKKTNLPKGPIDNLVMYYVGRVALDSGFISFLEHVIDVRYNCVYIIGAKRQDLTPELSSRLQYFESNIKIEFLGWYDDPYSCIPKQSKVFTTGYLSILEALENDLEIYSSYENPLKKDYLIHSPFSQYINIIDAEKNEILITREKLPNSVNWAEDFGWTRVVEAYERVWK